MRCETFVAASNLHSQNVCHACLATLREAALGGHRGGAAVVITSRSFAIARARRSELARFARMRKAESATLSQ